MDGGDSGFIKEHALDTCDHQMVTQIFCHGRQVDSSEVASGDNAGGQGLAVAVVEVVDQVGLPGQNDGQKWFGVLLKLHEGMELGKNFQAQQLCFVDHQSDFHFFAGHPLQYFLFDPAGHVCP